MPGGLKGKHLNSELVSHLVSDFGSDCGPDRGPDRGPDFGPDFASGQSFSVEFLFVHAHEFTSLHVRIAVCVSLQK